jgi:hypothetical protein
MLGLRRVGLKYLRPGEWGSWRDNRILKVIPMYPSPSRVSLQSHSGAITMVCFGFLDLESE